MRNFTINLLTNAIKFSPGAGEVLVSIFMENEYIYLRVKDFGMGIPETDIQALFQPFFRAGNVDAIQGTGLGLSIVKKALDLLNGRVTVRSAIGEGTEITVELPTT